MEPLFTSVNNAAEALDIGRTKTYELINSGKIKTITIGKRRLVVIDSLRALAKSDAA